MVLACFAGTFSDFFACRTRKSEHVVKSMEEEKGMPKKHQQRPAKTSAGRNNPKKSTVITSGTYKKPETYRQQAIAHENPEPLPQEAKAPPSRDPSEGRTRLADSQAMAEQGEKRSGSDSDANKHRKGGRLHEDRTSQNTPRPQPTDTDFDQDLRPENQAGENHGLPDFAVERGMTAYDVKELHTKLADLTDDELKDIPIMPLGSSLEQGATYIDLQYLEQGEFVAPTALMADEDHYYVPKKPLGYVLWNRLNQVSNPARLDERTNG
jgi:hypothetical protein